MKNLPLISVIIPTYNRANVLRNAIDSVLNQSYHNLEVIVVDDCSTDNTIEVLNEYDTRIKIIKHDVNLHVSAARNTGVYHSNGTYVAFLDSDDVWLKTKLMDQYDFMQNNSFEICVTNFNSLYENERGLENKNRPYFEINLENCLWGIYFAPGSTLLMKKSILLQIGGYNVNYKRIEDWEFFLRLLSLGFKVGFLQKCTTEISSSNSFTVQNLEKHCRMLLRDSVSSLNQLNVKFIKLLKSGINFELAVACWKNRRYFKALHYLIASFYFQPINNKSFQIILFPWLKTKFKIGL